MYWTGCLQQATDIQPTDTPRYPSSTLAAISETILSTCRDLFVMSLRLLMLVHILVSSANIFMLHSIHSGTSFTKSKNRSGPKTDPCGTPLITSSQIDSCPFMMLSHSSSSLLESRELCIALTAFLRPIFLCCSWNSLRQTSNVFLLSLIVHITVTVAPRSPLVALPTILCPFVAISRKCFNAVNETRWQIQFSEAVNCCKNLTVHHWI